MRVFSKVRVGPNSGTWFRNLTFQRLGNTLCSRFPPIPPYRLSKEVLWRVATQKLTALCEVPFSG